MAVEVFHLEWYRGDTVDAEVLDIFLHDGSAEKNPLLQSTDAVVLTVRRTELAEQVALEASTTAGELVITAGGRLQGNIPASKTALLEPGTNAYDIQRTRAGNVKTLLRGKLICIADITR